MSFPETARTTTPSCPSRRRRRHPTSCLLMGSTITILFDLAYCHNSFRIPQRTTTTTLPPTFCSRSRTATVAFAGGFGSSSSSNVRPSKKKNKKKKGSGLIKVATTTTTNTSKKKRSGKKKNIAGHTILHEDNKDDDVDVVVDMPKLDKWGLPIPTIEDIFPFMPDGTELIPASKINYSLDEIKLAMKDHIDLSSLDMIFNEQGVEKKVQDDNDSQQQREPIKVRLLHQSPPVLCFDNFFTEDECKIVEEVAMPSQSSKSTSRHHSNKQHQQQELEVEPIEVDSKTFPSALSTRTSTSWFCLYSHVPTLLAKAHYVLGLDYENMEEPQIVRYKTGQEFSWHYDEIPQQQLSNGGQRLATLLVYLNTLKEDEGGGTVFRDLKDIYGNTLTVRPKQGSALLFFPAYRDGKPDDRTLHKGEVANAEKRIIQMWIHESKYKAAVPMGNYQMDAMEKVQDIATRLGYLHHTK